MVNPGAAVDVVRDAAALGIPRVWLLKGHGGQTVEPQGERAEVEPVAGRRRDRPHTPGHGEQRGHREAGMEGTLEVEAS
jgi:hypothetical protein